MTREIKFRIYDKQFKKWIGLEYYKDLGAITVENDGVLTLGEAFRFTQSMMICPEAFDVMQYTGLKDKNGKEIYEGDIVKFKYGYRNKEKIASIKYGKWMESKCDEYDCEHYGYFIDYKWENYCENTGFDLYVTNEICEVIGNIYDNPELLEEEEER